MQIPELVRKVKEKKELQHLDDSFVHYYVTEYLRINKKERELIAGDKKSAIEKLVKHVRGIARPIFGVFVQPQAKSLLESHKSTQERLSFYSRFFEEIFKITGAPTSVLDLACGYNPIAFYEFTTLRTTQYVCQDIFDGKVLQDYFKNNSYDATYKPFDIIKNLDELRNKPFSHIFDICFLLKSLDTLESQSLHFSYDLFDAIRAKYIVVSFPTINVKGELLQRSSHNWFIKVLQRKNYSHTKIVFPNEVVYVCYISP